MPFLLPHQTEPSTRHEGVDIVLLSLSTWVIFKKSSLEVKAGMCRAVLLWRFWKNELNVRELKRSQQLETLLPLEEKEN